MAFPQDPLGTVVQMNINGVWTNVVRYDASTKILIDNDITIFTGTGGLQDRTPPGVCRWTWHDPNGVYNNENPRSPYYGLIPRNTPVRVYVPRATPALYIRDINDGSRGQTTDKAALDVLGDMEIRVDFEPRRFTRFASGANTGMHLASKYGASGNRSWYLRFGESGVNGTISRLAFTWSSTGSNAISASATAALPTTGRISVKVTLDVDNGAGGADVKFFTSTTGINGTYTQLGATVTLSGVSSVFNSTANLELGTTNGGALDFANLSTVENYIGRIYAFQFYNGIAGSLVASADYTAQTTGTTSFADGLGNTWTLGGTAEITNADYRFYGEFSQPITTVERSFSGTGIVVKTEAEAGGLIRRLTTNQQPLRSPLYYLYSTYASNGWWLGEDDATSDRNVASSGVTGVSPATIADITFAGYDSTLPGSAGVMVCGSTGPTFTGFCKSTTLTNETHFIGFFKFPSVPLSSIVIFNIYSNNGTVKRWTFSADATGYVLNGYDSAGTVTVTKSSLFGTGASPTDWIAYHLQLTNSAGTISIKSEWMSITTGAVFTANAIGTLSYAGSNGTFDRVVVQGLAAMGSMRFAQLMTSSQVGLVFYSGSDNNFAQYAAGFPGERADARFTRICQFLGISSVIVGQPLNARQLGPQPIATGMEILYQCAELDSSIITESTDQLALEYRGRRSLYNQFGLALTWAQLSEGLQRAADDTDVANDIIMSRVNGGNARATLEFGPNSIQSPPNGINTVTDNPEVNNYQDSELPLLVQFALTRRTWPTSRYPSVKIGLHRAPFIGSAALQLQATKSEISDIITITALPNFLAPEPLYLMIKGKNEVLGNRTRNIEFITVPYGPFQGAELQNNTNELYDFKAGHSTINGVVQTQVSTAFNAAATSISIKTLSGPLISTAVTSMVIKIGGERMTVTAVAGASSPQTLTVVRGLDGYTAAHAVNDYVYIDNIPLLARL